METKAQKTLKNKQQKPLTVKIFMTTVPVLLIHINTQFREGIKHKIHIKIMKKGGKKQDYLTVVEPEAHVLLLDP